MPCDQCRLATAAAALQSFNSMRTQAVFSCLIDLRYAEPAARCRLSSSHRVIAHVDQQTSLSLQPGRCALPLQRW